LTDSGRLAAIRTAGSRSFHLRVASRTFAESALLPGSRWM